MASEHENGQERRRARRGLGPAGLLRAFVIALGVLILLRLLLPVGLGRWVEGVLGRSQGYALEIAEIDLNLWRGAYEIEGLRLYEVKGLAEGPFFEARRIDLSIGWGALLTGTIVGEVVAHHPLLHTVLGSDPQSSQTGSDGRWIESLDALLPFRIDRVAVRDGELRIENRKRDPAVDVYMTDVYVEATNITNVRGRSSELPARIEAAGRPFDVGAFELYLALDPLAESPRLELDAVLRGIPVLELNDFLRAYGRVDAESGSFSMATELAIRDGRIGGYVKTFFEDLSLVSFDEIADPSDALEALWEGFVGLAAEVLENQPYDRLATRVPLRGSTDAVQADVLALVVSLMRNAFVVALRPVIDDSVGLGDLVLETGSSSES